MTLLADLDAFFQDSAGEGDRVWMTAPAARESSETRTATDRRGLVHVAAFG